MGNIKPIRNDEDYEAALGRIDELMDAEPDTPEGEELDVLVDLVDHYESKRVSAKGAQMSRKAEIIIEPASYRPIHAYLRAHAAKFRVYSLAIKPNLLDPSAIRQRIAFAILSANCPFAASVEALDYAIACDYDCDSELMGRYQCVPAKADWLRAMRARGADEFLRKAGETWIRYRERLKRTTPGLGRCKASFAVALLYPDQANVAVIDTHICHTYLGSEGFIDLSRANYEKIELDIIRMGRQYGLCGFQAHWAIWAFSSGIDHDHNIFPGEHKDSTIPF